MGFSVKRYLEVQHDISKYINAYNAHKKAMVYQKRDKSPWRKGKKKKYQKRLAVKGPLHAEVKFLDTASTTITTFNSTSWTTIELSNFAAGTGGSNIVGDQCLMKSATFKAFFQFGATTTGYGSVRVIMWYGDAASPSTFLTLNTITGLCDTDASTSNVLLYDKQKIWMNGAATFKGYVKLNHIGKVNTTSSVYLAWCHTGTLATATPTAQVEGRVRFIDA